jgi:2,3-bisphosphoglycerate-dependent phosphoglycerate mutase
VPPAPRRLVLLRHGESEFNSSDRFAGRLDVGLTDRGRDQAVRAGRLLRERGAVPDLVFTSPLRRAHETAALAAAAAGAAAVPVVCDALVERCYGALEGRRRSDVAAEVGTDQLQRWRRGWDDEPPSVAGGPAAESLHQVSRRVVGWWCSIDVPDDAQVLVVAHGNSLRVLLRFLDGLDDAATAALQITTGEPLLRPPLSARRVEPERTHP